MVFFCAFVRQSAAVTILRIRIFSTSTSVLLGGAEASRHASATLITVQRAALLSIAFAESCRVLMLFSDVSSSFACTLTVDASYNILQLCSGAFVNGFVTCCSDGVFRAAFSKLLSLGCSDARFPQRGCAAAFHS